MGGSPRTPRAEEEPTTSPELEFLFTARALRGGESRVSAAGAASASASAPATATEAATASQAAPTTAAAAVVAPATAAEAAASATATMRSANHLRRLSALAMPRFLSPDSVTRDGLERGRGFVGGRREGRRAREGGRNERKRSPFIKGGKRRNAKGRKRLSAMLRF